MDSMETQTELDISVVFRSDVMPGVAIAWKMGSSRLSLTRTGAKGAFVVAKKHSHTFRTIDGAEKGAAKWFVLLAAIYGPVETAVEAGTLSKKVVVAL